MSEGSIKRIALTNENASLEMLSVQLPPDVAALLASMQNASKSPIHNDALEMIAKIQASTQITERNNISSTSPGLKKEIENEISNFSSKNKMIKVVPQEIQKARELQSLIEKTKNVQDQKEKFTVYEEGIAFGIVIGKSNKSEVNLMLRNISSIVYSDFDEDLIAFYNDIYLTVLYNDEMIVREMQFGSKYKGSTAKGLKVGDHIDKAIEIYGQPKMKSVRGALWNKVGVFCENNFITSIRLMS